MEFRFGRAPAQVDAVVRISSSTRTAKPPRLLDFIALSGADDGRILAMARKYGPLFGDGSDLATTVQTAETADNWRRFSRLAACILAEGRALCSSGAGIDDKGRALLSEWSGIDITQSRNVRLRQFAVKSALDRWFNAGRLRVRTAWTGNTIETQATPGTLLGAIGLALADEIGGRGNRERCFECGAWFTVKRVLPPGTRRFCKKCGRPAAMKHLMRERRARKPER